MELLKKLIQSSPQDTNNSYTPNEIIVFETFNIEPIIDFDVRTAILQLPNKNSAGTDGLHAKIFKETVDTITKPLKILFNKFVQEGIFPASLKLAVVTPVFKSGDASNLNIYRPISVLQTISKIFEKIIGKRVFNFLNSDKFFNENQFGFLPNKNVDQALIKHIGEIVGELESGKKVTALYLDIKKEFDTVNHMILFKKLHNYGFKGKVYD